MTHYRLALTAGLLCLTRVSGAEAWYLPYQPDDQTILLAHLDDDQVLPGEGLQLKLVDGATRVPGRFGQAVRFERGKQQLQLSGTERLKFGVAEPFTIELWVNPADRRGGGLWSCGVRYYLHLGRSGEFGYRAASFPIRYRSLPGLDLTPGQWHHLAVTHDAGRVVTVYVDGEQVAQVTHDDEGDYAKGNAALQVGSHDGWTQFLHAEVDEIRVSSSVREFRPLLAQRMVVTGEAVKLALQPAGLPPEVGSARVVVRQGQRVVADQTVARADLGGELLPADRLPDGRSTCELRFLDAGGQVLGTAAATIENVTAAMQAYQHRVDALHAITAKAAPGPWREVLQGWLRDLDTRLPARQLDDFPARLTAAERVGQILTSGEAAYRAKLRQFVRPQPLPDDVRISMSWGRDAADAYPWAQRLGANELIAPHGSAEPEKLKAWKDAGYHTVMLAGTPIHDANWLGNHPENQQRGFWTSKPVEAKGDQTVITFSPPTWSTYQVDRGRLADWRVVDGHGKVIPPAQWSVDDQANRVTVNGTVPGESYRVYYAFRAPQFLDPLAPGSLERARDHLKEEIAGREGVLETYWFDDIGYGYPGGNELSPWDWESYALTAGPAQIRQFEQVTGIQFDPAWLVNLPRAIEGVPDPRYLTWMHWVRDRLKTFSAANTQVLAEAGMRSWLYWGDCHVGMEPYGGSLQPFTDVDKPAGDPVTARALTDIPGDVHRRMRSDWLFAHTAIQPKMGAHHQLVWSRPRRALLRQPNVRGIYWMVFDTLAFGTDRAVSEDVIETIAAVSDEFRLLNLELHDAEPYTHDLDLTILSAWGSNYAWRPWGDRLLTHLTDLPLRVHFASFSDVAEQGLPDGTDAVFCYGQPETAWSGGRYWADGKVAAALTAHVKAGGGLVALQAASECDGKWALSDLLGVTPTGPGAEHIQRIDRAELMDVADEGAEIPQGQAYLALAKSQAGGFLAHGVPARVPGLQEWQSVSAAQNTTVAALMDDGKGAASPGVVTREVGQGRTVYLSGMSPDEAFGRLLRNAIYWSAQREAQAVQLETNDESAFVYAYPNVQLLAIHNGLPEAREVTVRVDPAVLGVTSPDLVLTEVVTGEVTRLKAAELKAGAELNVPADGVGMWRVATSR